MPVLFSILALAAGLSSEQALIEGRPDSRVRVLIYEDLQCPDCAAFRRMLDQQILPLYGSKVAFIHLDFPLAKHVWARRAAIAARFFGERKPGLGLAYRVHVMSNIQNITPTNFNEKLTEFSQKHGINPKDALAALDDKKYADWVEKDFQDGVARGVSKTPTVFVNGKPFIEHFSFEEISKAIDEALAETN